MVLAGRERLDGLGHLTRAVDVPGGGARLNEVGRDREYAGIVDSVDAGVVPDLSQVTGGRRVLALEDLGDAKRPQALQPVPVRSRGDGERDGLCREPFRLGDAASSGGDLRADADVGGGVPDRLLLLHGPLIEQRLDGVPAPGPRLELTQVHAADEVAFRLAARLTQREQRADAGPGVGQLAAPDAADGEHPVRRQVDQVRRAGVRQGPVPGELGVAGLGAQVPHPHQPRQRGPFRCPVACGGGELDRLLPPSRRLRNVRHHGDSAVHRHSLIHQRPEPGVALRFREGTDQARRLRRLRAGVLVRVNEQDQRPGPCGGVGQQIDGAAKQLANPAKLAGDEPVPGGREQPLRPCGSLRRSQPQRVLAEFGRARRGPPAARLLRRAGDDSRRVLVRMTARQRQVPGGVFGVACRGRHRLVQPAELRGPRGGGRGGTEQRM